MVNDSSVCQFLQAHYGIPVDILAKIRSVHLAFADDLEHLKLPIHIMYVTVTELVARCFEVQTVKDSGSWSSLYM